jgi:hypothetical protein
MTERTTIRLPAELLHQAKRRAAAQGCTLTALIEEGLRRVVSERPGVSRERRVQPRISRARGGLLPGIELVGQGSLHEIDDLERVRRMNRRR